MKRLFFFLAFSLSLFSKHLFSQSRPPLSTLLCTSLHVSLPFSLSFDKPMAGTITDKNGQGTGFIPMVNYAGAHLSRNGAVSNTRSTGSEYLTASVNITSISLTNSAANAGLFVFHRNGTNPVTYSFDSFNVISATPSTNRLCFHLLVIIFH